MEGYYWRFADPGGGWSVAVIAGVCRAADGTWAMITLAAEPGGVARTELAPVATAHPARLGVDAPPLLRADADGIAVDLGAGARLEARFARRRDWPRRRWGALGPAQMVPGLGQYWFPHLLGAAVTGTAEIGARRYDLATAAVYAEKNWGEHFAGRWWWGQAPLGDGAGVAFAGGRVRRAGVEAAPTALVAWTARDVVALTPPVARTVARLAPGSWHVHARSPWASAELDGEAPGAGLSLAVPVVAERRAEPRSTQHLLGAVRVRVRRGRRPWLDAESLAAALESGLEQP
jgi:tocopherol cyclase